MSVPSPTFGTPSHQTPAGRAVGIDLGTTHSLVAWVSGRGSQARCFAADEGSVLLPSAVGWIDGEKLVGRQALRAAAAHPRQVVTSSKRFLGRSASDPEVRRLSPYRFATDTGPVVRFDLDGKIVTPVEVSAEVLRRLRQVAEAELGPVTHAVITVPAYFDDAQRQATRDAARLCGLEVLRLLNEPTAAAIAYGLDTQRQGSFAVYDLGGGTFDISILHLDDGVFEVRATGGDSALGGDDFDRALAHWALEQWQVIDPSAGAVRAVLDAARAAKEALTDAAETTLSATWDGETRSVVVSREQFEALALPLVQKTAPACQRALADAAVDRLDGVVLVGGSTRMPIVRRFVRDLFGREPLCDLDPDQVVALGAAIQANQLSGDEKAHDDILLLDVCPLSLGVETMGGLVDRIIPRNTSIPVSMEQTFTTFADGQTGLEVHVVQGEREFVQDCRSLARFTLRGIPPLPAGMARVRITFELDADGLLSVRAKEELTGVSQQIQVRPSHGLTDAEVERILLDSFDNGEDDLEARFLVEARVEAQRMWNAAQKQLSDNGDLLSAEEKAPIEAALQAVAEAAQSDDHGVLRTRLQELDTASADFARRIMDRSIQRAIGGRSIDTF